MDPQIIYPSEMDEYDWALTESKGWIEVTVRWAAGERAVTFYDPSRLAQSVNDMLGHQGYFAEPAVVVVPRLTKDALEATVALLAQHAFVDVR